MFEINQQLNTYDSMSNLEYLYSSEPNHKVLVLDEYNNLQYSQLVSSIKPHIDDMNNDLENKKTLPQTERLTSEVFDFIVRKSPDIMEEIKSNSKLFNLFKETLLNLSNETSNFKIKEELISIKSKSSQTKVVNSKCIVFDYLNSYFNENLLEEYIIIERYEEEITNKQKDSKKMVKLAQLAIEQQFNKQNSFTLKDIHGDIFHIDQKDCKDFIENSIHYYKVIDIFNKETYISKQELDKGRNVLGKLNYEDYMNISHQINFYDYIAKSILSNNIDFTIKSSNTSQSMRLRLTLNSTYNNDLEQNICILLYDINYKLHLINSKYISKKTIEESKKEYTDVNGHIFTISSKEIQHYHVDNELNQAVKLIDVNNQTFYAKKCFIKHLINKIIHNEHLSESESIYDIYGQKRTFSPITTYETLILSTNIADCILLKDNKYVVVIDSKTKKASLIDREIVLSHISKGNEYKREGSCTVRQSKHISLKTISGQIIQFNKEQTNLEECYVKIYDLTENSYIVTYTSLKNLYDKLANKELLEALESFDTLSSGSILLKPAYIRSRPPNYFTINVSDTKKKICPYRIIEEEKKSYFPITNLLQGNQIMIRTYALLNLLKSNPGKDFIQINELNIKVSTEEIKQTIKALNISNEYIEVNDINKAKFYMKKKIIFTQINILIQNKGINEIIEVIDNEHKPHYVSIQKLFIENIEVSPIPYIKDEILYQQYNTYHQLKNGSFEIKSNEKEICELIEFIKVNDKYKKPCYIRKPFIRNMLISGMKIPSLIEVNDIYFNQIRLIKKQDLFKIDSYQTEYSNKSQSPSNFSITFKAQTYIEIYDSNHNKHLLLKDKLLSVIKCDHPHQFPLVDNLNNTFKTTRDNILLINLTNEWLKIKDIQNHDIFIYKSIIKRIVNDSMNKISLVDRQDVYDYQCKKHTINPNEIIANLILKKRTINQHIIIEIWEK